MIPRRSRFVTFRESWPLERATKSHTLAIFNWKVTFCREWEGIGEVARVVPERKKRGARLFAFIELIKMREESINASSPVCCLLLSSSSFQQKSCKKNLPHAYVTDRRTSKTLCWPPVVEKEANENVRQNKKGFHSGKIIRDPALCGLLENINKAFCLYSSAVEGKNSRFAFMILNYFIIRYPSRKKRIE